MIPSKIIKKGPGKSTALLSAFRNGLSTLSAIMLR